MHAQRTHAARRSAAPQLHAPQQGHTTLARIRSLAPLAIVAAVSLTLRLYRLDAQSLWLDEGSTWAEITGRTGKGWSTLLLELFSADAAYPLYHLLLRAWTAVFGDTVWALRLPSALAGTLAVLAIAGAARELATHRDTRHAARDARHESLIFQARSWPGMLARGAWLVPSILMATAPFALWYAQEVKTYSLLLLLLSGALWALLRALRLGTARAWAYYGALALLAFFTHRLALLMVVAGLAAALLARPPMRLWWRYLGWASVLALAAVAVAGAVAAVGSESATSGGHIPAGPLIAAWLTFGRLALDRGLGSPLGFIGLASDAPEFPRFWLLPSALLWAWGLALLLRDSRQGHKAALAVLLAGAVPLLLFCLTTAMTRLYEPRYMMLVFPAWLLTLAYPVLRHTPSGSSGAPAGSTTMVLAWSLLALTLLSHGTTLLQPVKGLFSGDPVKEQWHEAITALARRVHPDDLVLLHPYYVQPLWDYYAPRVTADPLPTPVTFAIFGEGYRGTSPTPEQAREYVRQNYLRLFQNAARGHDRALLLVAPEHARTIDPPLTLPQLQAKARAERWDDVPTAGDTYGVLGLSFQYPQRTWPCGGDKFVGVHLMCQSFPERYGSGKPPAPATTLDAAFGNQLLLSGFTLKPPHADGRFRAGGTLPLTLYWQAAGPPQAAYSMFLHLCQNCDAPPAASDDGPPLLGYEPAGDTRTWLVGDPVHDERAILLPRDMPPGRYTLLLGVYPAGQPAIASRLAVAGSQSLGQGRLLLAEVDIVAGDE